MARTYTEQEKLEVIEHMIEQWRPASESGSIMGERDTLFILKSIGKDIRGRMPNAPGRARDRLQRDIARAKTERARERANGYSVPNLRKIAETTISEWSTIRQALEQFEHQVSTEES